MPLPSRTPDGERPAAQRPLVIAINTIDLLARIVPGTLRRDWANEWKAELWYRARRAVARDLCLPREVLNRGCEAPS